MRYSFGMWQSQKKKELILANCWSYCCCEAVCLVWKCPDLMYNAFKSAAFSEDVHHFSYCCFSSVLLNLFLYHTVIMPFTLQEHTFLNSLTQQKWLWYTFSSSASPHSLHSVHLSLLTFSRLCREMVTGEPHLCLSSLPCIQLPHCCCCCWVVLQISAGGL